MAGTEKSHGCDKTGLQFSLAVNGSTSTTDKAKVDSKSRWTTSDAYGYQSSLDHETSESTSDIHFVAELGSENMLLDFGISGGDSAEIEQEFKAWTQPTSDPIRTLPSLPLNSYSETSESHSSAGLVLGGDDPGLTSSGGYSVDIESTHEIHGEWIVGVMIITGFHETYHDHGGDVESTQTPQHRLTQQIFGVNGQETIVVFDKAPEPTSPTPPRSLEDILNEYRDLQTQLARLQAELAETTDPAMQKFLQDQINVETNILADITTAALAAGATQEDLDQITNEAQEAGENDPIDPDEGDGGDSVWWAAFWGWKEGEAQGALNSVNGVQDILIGMGNFGAQTSPAGIIGSFFGFDPLNIESPDWSNGVITTEDPTLHGWSKWLGGNGLVSLASMFPFLPKGFKSGDLVKVDIRRLTYSSQKECAFANELMEMGKFNMAKYLENPAIVELKKNGVMVVQWGFHRIAVAEKAAVLSGDWFLPVRLFLR